MSPEFSEDDYQRVKSAVIAIRKTGHTANGFQYFFAFSLKQIDPMVSTAMAEKYLPKLAAESPLEDGIIVERFTPREEGLTTWMVGLNE